MQGKEAYMLYLLTWCLNLIVFSLISRLAINIPAILAKGKNKNIMILSFLLFILSFFTLNECNYFNMDIGRIISYICIGGSGTLFWVVAPIPQKKHKKRLKDRNK